MTHSRLSGGLIPPTLTADLSYKFSLVRPLTVTAPSLSVHCLSAALGGLPIMMKWQ
jgi:hypothetical protein